MRCKKIHLCIHRNCWTALAHPSVWAGYAGVLTTTAAQLDAPYGTLCLLISVVCSFIAIIIRTPQEGDKRYGVTSSNTDTK